MGAWGNKIYQNDTAMDIKDSYKKLLQDGKSTEEAYEEMFESYSDVLSSEYVDDIIIFYLSFADTLWNYGRLTNELKEAALKIISECIEDKKKNKEESYCVYSVKVLEELETKLKSEQPKEKKVRKVIPYVCDWNNYDVFSYKLESDYAKEKGIYGRHLMFIKIDIYENSVGGKDPVFWIKITDDDKIPKTVEEINNLDFIQLRSETYEDKNSLELIEILSKKYENKIIPECVERVLKYHEENYKKAKEERKNILFDKYGGIPVYRTGIWTKSKRSIPKKLIYIGNFPGIFHPTNENKMMDSVSILYAAWNNIEEAAIESYYYYNKSEIIEYLRKIDRLDRWGYFPHYNQFVENIDKNVWYKVKIIVESINYNKKIYYSIKLKDDNKDLLFDANLEPENELDLNSKTGEILVEYGCESEEANKVELSSVMDTNFSMLREKVDKNKYRYRCKNPLSETYDALVFTIDFIPMVESIKTIKL